MQGSSPLPSLGEWLYKEVPGSEGVTCPGLKKLSSYTGWNPGNPALLTAPVSGQGKNSRRTPNQDPSVKETAPQGPETSTQRPRARLRTQFPPRLTLGKVWGSQPSRLENQKPLPLHWGQMQKRQWQRAVRSGKEPFSSCAVAKHPLPGLPARCLDTQPQPARPPAPGKVGPAPLPWPWAACGGRTRPPDSLTRDLAPAWFYPLPDPLQTIPLGCSPSRSQWQGDGQQEAGKGPQGRESWLTISIPTGWTHRWNRRGPGAPSLWSLHRDFKFFVGGGLRPQAWG